MFRYPDNQLAHRLRGTRRPSGFTLLEMLLVIAILGLLVSIAVPSLLAVRRRAKISVSQQRIDSIAAGVEQYHSEQGDYPPASIDGLSSARTLCLYMIGWAEDKNHDGQAAKGAFKFHEDDGNDGFGWRRPDSPRGRVYGPYNGLDDAPRSDESTPVILDEFGNTIWYARYDDASGKMVIKDDPGLPGKYFQDEDDKYYRKDFAVFSAGPDEEFQRQATDSESDDLSNFQPQ